MSVPTNSEILRLLDRLANESADELESQWLDFKNWNDPKNDMRVAIEYAVCLANCEGGVVVFGVADKVRGRSAAIHGASWSNSALWHRAGALQAAGGQELHANGSAYICQGTSDLRCTGLERWSDEDVSKTAGK
jgi:hypothetical protein